MGTLRGKDNQTTENGTVRILLLVGGSHYDGPDIRATLSGFLDAPDDFEVTMSEDMDVLTKENLANCGIIVNVTTDREPPTRSTTRSWMLSSGAGSRAGACPGVGAGLVPARP